MFGKRTREAGHWVKAHHIHLPITVNVNLELRVKKQQLTESEATDCGKSQHYCHDGEDDCSYIRGTVLLALTYYIQQFSLRRSSNRDETNGHSFSLPNSNVCASCRLLIGSKPVADFLTIPSSHQKHRNSDNLRGASCWSSRWRYNHRPRLL